MQNMTLTSEVCLQLGDCYATILKVSVQASVEAQTLTGGEAPAS